MENSATENPNPNPQQQELNNAQAVLLANYTFFQSSKVAKAMKELRHKIKEFLAKALVKDFLREQKIKPESLTEGVKAAISRLMRKAFSQQEEKAIMELVKSQQQK